MQSIVLLFFIFAARGLLPAAAKKGEQPFAS